MVKAVRAEGQPKRPMSSYFLWLNEEGRATAKKQNPDAPITEVSKKCGEMWRGLGDATKKKYEKMQEVAKAKYEEDYKVWLADGGEEALKEAKKETQTKKDKKSAKATGDWA
eukprot:GFUD01024123.1.p1 GENE.GFUD01024123.1~~GFUD01024123.1.p1  ORF type:complete len:112 (+),score=40.99 GFUD01024123.1:63-398(+)